MRRYWRPLTFWSQLWLLVAVRPIATEASDAPMAMRFGGTERRAVAGGQDIYAVAAPLAVGAVRRIPTGQTLAIGAASAGEIFDAPAFLRAHITLERATRQRSPLPRRY